MRYVSLLIVGLVLCLSVSSAKGGLMLQPTGASTNMGSVTGFEPTYARDQSGLAASYTSGITDFDTFVPTTGTSGGGNSLTTWFSQFSITGNFDFTLGGLFTIQSFGYWADPQGVGQSVKSFTLLADDNAAFSSPVNLGTFTAADGTGIANNATNFGQVFTFTPTEASFVRMQIQSNHGSTLTTGIVEAAFEVPEPSVIGLVGFAGLLGLRRRRLA